MGWRILSLRAIHLTNARSGQLDRVPGAVPVTWIHCPQFERELMGAASCRVSDNGCNFKRVFFSDATLLRRNLDLQRAVKYLQIPLIIVLLISAGVLMGEKSLKQRRKLAEKKRFMVAENLQLAHQIESLEREVMSLRSDSKIIERVAKRKLGMARPDETVYIFGRRNHTARAANSCWMSLRL